MATWKKIGTVGAPQGLNGSFFLVGEREINPASPSIVIGEHPSSGIPATIQTKKCIQGQWVLKIRGVEERKALEGIRGQILWAKLTGLEHESLEGFSVLNPSGQEIGKVVALTNHGASDIVVVENAEGSFVDLPLVADYFSLPPNANRTLHLVLEANAFHDLWYK